MSVVTHLAALLSGRHTAADPGSLDDLVAAADAHGVAALLWQRVSGDDTFHRELTAALRPVARTAAARDLLAQRELRGVLDALGAAGVPALVVKGAALAYTVYDEPWHRPRVDTDILVGATEVERGGAVLTSRGYARCDALSSGAYVSHQLAFERTDPHGMRHVVDLHWKVVNPQVLADVLPFDRLWATARPAPALGAAARVPAPEASVVLACVHRLAHHQDHERLIWLYDLALLAGSLTTEEWASLTELAIARGVAGLCLDGLRRTSEVLGVPIPEDVEAALAAAVPGEPSARYLAGTLRKRDVLVSDLSHLPSWRARLRLLREHVLPPPAFVMSRYGARHRLLLPALYAHRLVTGAWRWMRA